MAFCHKVTAHIQRSNSARSSPQLETEELVSPPDLHQPVLLEVQSVKVHGVISKLMFDNGSTTALITHAFAERLSLKGDLVAYWLAVVGHEPVLRNTTLYTFFLQDNLGNVHEIKAYGIDAISEDSVVLDLSGVKSIFPGAPKEVYERPSGPIDILIGSAYRNIQPYGGEDTFTKGRLRLVKSFFGCGFILTGTHLSITTRFLSSLRQMRWVSCQPSRVRKR